MDSMMVTEPISLSNLVPLIRIFISSPGDLVPERAAARDVVMQKLLEYPHINGRFAPLAYTYEHTVPPIIGEGPQPTVDKYLLKPQDADILVCLLWRRMGTPTPDLINPLTGQPYQSGTEYELLTAYHNRRPDGSPFILLYHCERPAEFGDFQDAEQQARVDSLLARFRSEGDLKGLIKSFTTVEDLRVMLEMDLLQVIEKGLKPLLDARRSRIDRARNRVIVLPDNLPNDYVARPEALTALKQALLGSPEQVGVVAATAVQGMGGLGKTVLARAAWRTDRDIQSAFPDGILWATLGEQANPFEEQRRWIRALGGDGQSAMTIRDAKEELQRLLENRAMLLVLDDVWHAEDAEALRVGGPECRVLVTTRNLEAAPGAHLIPLQGMTRAESHDLLRRASAGKVTDVAMLDEITDRLGNLPLALSLVGAQLRTELPWATIRARLDRHDLRFGPQKDKTIFAAIASSIQALPRTDQARYLELVVFPPDEPLDPAAVARLWGRPRQFLAIWQPRPLSRMETEETLARFRACSLVQPGNALHDLQFDYLQGAISSSHRRTLHRTLAAAYGDLTSWPLLPESESWAWRWLTWNLKQADQLDDVRSLVTDGRYVQRKITVNGTEAVASEVDYLAKEPGIAQFASALRLSAHVLDRHPGQLASQLTGRLGTDSPLHDIPFSRPDFRLRSQSLISPGGHLLRTLTGDTKPVEACVFSPDDSILATASRGGIVRLWDITTGQEHATLKTAKEDESVDAYAFSSDIHMLAVVSESSALPRESAIRLWDITSGQEQATIPGHIRKVDICAFSPDGRTLATAGWDYTVRLWECDTGRELAALAGHTDLVIACAFSSDGRTLATISRNGKVYLWDVGSSQERAIFFTRTNRSKTHIANTKLTACAFSPDGRTLAAASQDGAVRLWDIASGQERATLTDSGVTVTACIFSPDGRSLATASRDGMIRLWDSSSSTLRFTLKGHAGIVTACAFSSGGHLLATVSRDGIVRLWNITSGPEPTILAGHSRAVSACTFSPDGRIFATAAWDHTVRLWDVISHQEYASLPGNTTAVMACVFNSEGHLLTTASVDGAVRLWDVASGEERAAIILHTDSVLACAFTPDGQLLAIASRDGVIRLWDVSSGQERTTFSEHARFVTSCAFSPDARTLVTASQGAGRIPSWVRLWDVSSGQKRSTGFRHTNTVTTCAFNSDGQLLATASREGAVRLWSITSGLELARCDVDAPLTSCAWHPKEPLIAAGDQSGTIHWFSVDLP